METKENQVQDILLILWKNAQKRIQYWFYTDSLLIHYIIFWTFNTSAEPFRVRWSYWLWRSRNLSHLRRGMLASLSQLFNHNFHSSCMFHPIIYFRITLLSKLLLLIEKWTHKSLKSADLMCPTLNFMLYLHHCSKQTVVKFLVIYKSVYVYSVQYFSLKILTYCYF